MPSPAFDPRDSPVRGARDRRRDTRDRERDRSVSEEESTEDESTADEREKEKDRERERDRERDRDRDRVRQRRHRDSFAPRDSAPLPPPPASPPSRRISLTERIKGTFLRRSSNPDGRPPSPTARRGSSSNAGGSSSGSKSSPVYRIRDWLDTCNNQHGRHCNGESESSSTPGTFRPQFLIDAADKCLVRATPEDRYVALSYVWGPTLRHSGPDAPVQLLKSNLDAWLTALPEDNVPRTIVDAIWLARKLGLRHIWIDRMCIVQDDEAVKEDHIRHMAYVFANAYLTIVAAHNDVNTGLLALNPRRNSRPPRVGGSTNVDHSELLLASRWNTRGWTLQELLYSRRAVFFFEDTVTWECHCDLWQGTGAGGGGFGRGGLWKGKKPECTNRIASSAFGFQHSPWPDMDEYARIAADYSARRVTQVDDTLRAFSGITTVLARVFPGGFIYGMPLMFLDSALLWRPQASIRRRALSRAPFLPSWSWMGWWFDGIRVDLTLWKAAADYVKDTRTTGKRGQLVRRFQSPSAFQIRPTVVWRLSDRRSDVPAPNDGLQFRELRSRRNAAAALPPGWSRSGEHFVHDSDADTVFRYPVPVADPPEVGEHPPPPGELEYPGPLLAFKTTGGIFDVDFSVTLSPKDTINPPVAVGNIWGRGRKWIGEFRAHDGWLGIQSSNYDGDEKLEFIAISSVTERWGSLVFPPDRYEEHAVSDRLDVVNVLWIERIAGVCYRRGIGHVIQKAWDAHAANEVEILLG
ncbi:Heterokaryon incompatibility [Akanthomyces lecanii RCEF 1005]|uniref:Heterokaryon incompatibility n=1 Tax=Akanthomyces lecanii RCEF 1005 TaxID=1081108 RepID=A0A168HFB4_CORDF|nr:Heterokaryon incompatibility [Akanthomyces lecanii RCEF 1005]